MRALFGAALLLLAAPLAADVKFTRLSEDQYVIHHRKKTLLGAEAKAVRTVYAEAASVCLAAGFSHLELKEQNVGERHHGSMWGGGRGASADIRVRFFLAPEPAVIEEKELIECEPLADHEKTEVARKKLAKEKGN